MKSLLRRKLAWATAVYGFDFSFYIRNGFWLVLAQVMMSLLSLGLTLGFANLLSREDYGSYKYVLSIFQLLAIFSLPEIGTAVMLAIGKKRLFNIHSIVRMQRTWALLGTGAGLLLAAYTAYTGDRAVALLLICASLFMPLHASYGIYDPLLRGVGDFKASSLANACSQAIVVFAVLSALLLTRSGAFSALVFFIASTATRAGYYLYYKRQARFQKYADLNTEGISDRSVFIEQAKALSWIKGLGQVSASASQLALYHIVGPSALSMYAVAIAPTEQVRGLLSTGGNLFLSKAVIRSWNREEYRAFLKKRLPFFILPTLFVCFFYLVIAPFVFRFVFEQYQEVVRLSQVYFFTLPLTLVNIILGIIIKAKELIRDLHQLNALSICMAFGAVLPLAIVFGLWGLAIGVILQKITEALWMHHCIRRASLIPER